MAKRVTQADKLAQLETKLAEQEAALEVAKAEAEEAKARAEHFAQLNEDGVSVAPSEPTDSFDPTPKVLYDPYDSQNPHKFIAHPQGYKLGWKNAKFRENHRGWKGWRVVQYDDFIGRELHKYLLDPPRRMEHNVDNVVRRGDDTILCYLEESLWRARQQKRTDRAQRLVAPHQEDFKTERPTQGKFVSNQADRSGRHVGGTTMTSK